MEGDSVKLRVSGDVRLLHRPFIKFGKLEETWRSFLVRHEVKVGTTLPSQVYIESQNNPTLDEVHECAGGMKLTAALDDQIVDMIKKFKPSMEYGVIVKCTDQIGFPGQGSQSTVKDQGGNSIGTVRVAPTSKVPRRISLIRLNSAALKGNQENDMHNTDPPQRLDMPEEEDSMEMYDSAPIKWETTQPSWEEKDNADEDGEEEDSSMDRDESRELSLEPLDADISEMINDLRRTHNMASSLWEEVSMLD